MVFPGIWGVSIVIEIRRYDGPVALAAAAADLFAERASQAIAEKGRFEVALSGGSTPKQLYMLLANRRDIDWPQVHIFWGDERAVSPDHPESNFGMVKETLLEQVPATHIYRIEAERGAEEAAAAYQRILQDRFGEGNPPLFDLVLLGLGGDGHTASLFPGSDALQPAHGQWVAATSMPSAGVDRVTLTVPAINAAQLVVFLVSGAAKAQVVADVLDRETPQSTYPAQLIAPERGNLIWLVDSAAAAKLHRQA